MELISATIKDLSLDILKGRTPSKTIKEYYDGDINLYTPEDFSEDIYLSKATTTISSKAIQDNNAPIFPPGTVFITCAKDIGKVAILKESSSSNQQIIGILLDRRKIIPELFYHWCRRNKKLLLTKAELRINKALNTNALASMSIEYPVKIEDQFRIATLLSQIEELIIKRLNTIKLIDKLQRNTFLDMFGHPVINKKGWEEMPLKDLGELGRGVSKHRPRNTPDLFGGKYPLIEVKDINVDNIYLTSYSKTYSEKGLEQSRLWKSGTLCITVAAVIAKTNILTFDACFPDTMVGMVVDSSKTNNLFMYFTFKYLQSTLERKAPGSAQKNINLRILENLKIPLPPLELQSNFAEIVEKIELIKSSYSESLEELNNLYSSISQRAFRGELDLSGIIIPDNISEGQINDFNPITHHYPEIKKDKIWDDVELLKKIKEDKVTSLSFEKLYQDYWNKFIIETEEWQNSDELAGYEQLKNALFKLLKKRKLKQVMNKKEDTMEIEILFEVVK